MFSQVPSASVTVEGNPALNRVRWANSGREVAVGDSEGRVHIYDVGEVRARHLPYKPYCRFHTLARKKTRTFLETSCDFFFCVK